MSSPGEHWEHFAHGADIGVRGVGATPAAAFAQVGLALTAVVTEPERVRPSEEVAIECEASDLDDLLYDWLDALVFEMSAHRRLLGRFEVSIDDGHLHARAWGETVDPARHAPAVEVKGPTYTELRVRCSPDDGRWTAQCVVDV